MGLGGSSPRAWEPRIGADGARGAHRFIPTCVGTTSWAKKIAAVFTVHPHVRGNHSQANHLDHVAPGSSPRAWEPQRPLLSFLMERRFIPTCVGTTPELVELIAAVAVHPHVRGNHSSPPLSPSFLPGSSPRAWEPRITRPGRWLSSRFIPTCVGTTVRHGERSLEHSVHPHVRGNHREFPSLSYLYSGSSPRAWEPHPGLRLTLTKLRFIPTCVGTTRGAHALGVARAVHPHVRGNHERVRASKRL